MADANETSSDAQITFKVKTGSDGNHTITMSESATVLDLKNKLAGADFEDIAVERQRLIYSGRVMKNDDTLATYKIKANNTVHMVKSAASNPGQPAATSNPTSTSQTIPQNMASGTANNPLAGLTGARFAGHGINMPGMDLFGPDGGMGPPMDEDRLSRMMSDPNVQQSMNEALNNPDFINMLIESNPMLRNMPNARELISSPFMRQMMTNPQLMSQVMRMQRGMGGGGGDGAFPAPGATNTTDGAASEPSNDQSGNNQASGNDQGNAFANPFLMPGMMGGAGAGAGRGGTGMSMTQVMQYLNEAGLNPLDPLGQQPQANRTQTDSSGATGQAGATDTQQGSANNQNQAAANPFAALFPPSGGSQQNPLGMNPEMMQQLMQVMGGGLGGGLGSGLGGGAPTGPPDDRPPEVRYEEQLRQLNDMGFHDFDRNVAALRRSGGSVQGAVEYLLSG